MSLTYSPPLTSNEDKRCPRCHATWLMVVVHGHEQCAYCKSNVVECCSGEVCDKTTTTSSKWEDWSLTFVN